jgi:dienelactone hydrolase
MQLRETTVMEVSFCAVAILLLGCLSEIYAADQQPWQKEFYPPSGRGRVVVVISGHLGPGAIAYYAKDIAAQGYYAVLVDGRDFWKKGYWSSGTGSARLRGVIARAQQSPHALPGKAAVIAFSLGGASALTYAARMPDSVSAVVTYYPDTEFISNPGDFVSKIKVPTLIFAGVLDTYENCCVIEKARQLAAAAQARGGGATLRVVEYPDAGHGFVIKSIKGWRGNDAADAFRRTLDYLQRIST